MTAKQYLCQIERFDMLIKNRQTEISQLWDLVTHITTPYDGDRVQSSSSDDRIGGLVAKIADLEKERDEYIEKYMKVKEDAIKIMEKMTDIRYYKILFKRYVEYNSLSKIAKEGVYTYRHVKRLHYEALKEFEKTKL